MARQTATKHLKCSVMPATTESLSSIPRTCMEIVFHISFQVLVFFVDISCLLAEETLGKWFASTGRRSEVFLATKFGGLDMRPESERPELPNFGGAPPPNSRPSYILRQLQRSLSFLQTDHIDLYYQHRPDPHVPIEVVLETLRPAFNDGRVRWFGLSECSVDVVRRAKAVDGLGGKVICVQMEYSPFELVHEKSGFFSEMENMGVGVVAYSPLGRGLITGKQVPCFL